MNNLAQWDKFIERPTLNLDYWGGTKWFPHCLGNHRSVYETLTSAGWTDHKSYASVGTHERYLKQWPNGNKAFIWSNAEAIHSVEFSSPELMEKVMIAVYREYPMSNLFVDSQTIKIILTQTNINIIERVCQSL